MHSHLILYWPDLPAPRQVLRHQTPVGPLAAQHQLDRACQQLLERLPGPMPMALLVATSSLAPPLQLLQHLPLSLWRGKGLEAPGQLPVAPPLVNLLPTLQLGPWHLGARPLFQRLPRQPPVRFALDLTEHSLRT